MTKSIRNKATHIKTLNNWLSDARLYELDKPIEYDETGADKNPTTKYIIVSAVDVIFSGPETFIFPAHADGTVINHLEMDGSYKGGLSHSMALMNAELDEVIEIDNEQETP